MTRSNAIQHNRQEMPGTWVSADCLAETVEIRIGDNGSGVDDAHKETIFGRGKQRLDSDGTGIGLYLVQSLVDRYGGDVWVEDREPQNVSSNQLQTDNSKSTGAVFVVQLGIHGEDEQLQQQAEMQEDEQFSSCNRFVEQLDCTTHRHIWGALCCNPFKSGPTEDTTKTIAQRAGVNICSDSDSGTQGVTFLL